MEITEEKRIKKEMEQFNFGAFGFTWIWGIFNGSIKETCPVIVLCILSKVFPEWSSLASLFIICYAIYCGLNGNKWAYKNKKFENTDKFIKIQRKWAIGTIILFLSTIIGIIIYCVVMVKNFINNPEKAYNQIVVYALAQEKGFTDGNDIAKKLIESKSMESSSGDSKAELYNSNSIILTYKSSKSQNVISFYKDGKCSLKEKNCYIEFYDVKDNKLIHKSTTYYDEFGKSEYIKINQ